MSGLWADPRHPALSAWGVGGGLRLQSVSSSRRAHLGGGVGGAAGGAHPVFSGISGSAAEGTPGFASRAKVGNCPPSYVRGAERLCRNPYLCLYAEPIPDTVGGLCPDLSRLGKSIRSRSFAPVHPGAYAKNPPY